ncbi:hypothetical protein B0G38_003336 [Arthrobacter sp. VKM Ac-2550]|nr:hypothetical protein [Arthrobacter sp. VKM Ac-2550]
MQDQHVRLHRAAIVSVGILSLSAAAHVTGGGTLPPVGIVLGLAAMKVGLSRRY